MLNILLWALLLAFSSSLFSLSFSYSGVSRSFTGLGKGIAESSVIKIDDDGTDLMKPYFDKLSFRMATEKYFASALKRYLSSNQKPTYTYLFYDASSIDPSSPVSYMPTGVKLTFSCPVSIFLTYSNSVSFFIKKGAMYGK